jgi:hypothetical protein
LASPDNVTPYKSSSGLFENEDEHEHGDQAIRASSLIVLVVVLRRRFVHDRLTEDDDEHEYDQAIPGSPLIVVDVFTTG